MKHRNKHFKNLIFSILLGLLLNVIHCKSSTAGDDGKNSKAETQERILFEESFENTDWEARGWYDGPKMVITPEEHIPGSSHSCLWHWKKARDIKPEGGGGRVLIDPVTSVTLSYYIKHSANWTWTGVNWHPHELHFLTTEDHSLVGPAYTHLTFYVEVVNGVPRIAIQDGKNIDISRIGEDLTGLTENRAVAGGNGDSDGYGNLGYYPNQGVYWNGKHWEPDKKYFSDVTGPYYKGDWHHIRVTIGLNSVKDGIGLRDGILQYWYDNTLIMDYHDVVYRTGRHPNMLINQFMMAPYYGPGVPHEQKIWIDELKITSNDE